MQTTTRPDARSHGSISQACCKIRAAAVGCNLIGTTSVTGTAEPDR